MCCLSSRKFTDLEVWYLDNNLLLIAHPEIQAKQKGHRLEKPCRSNFKTLSRQGQWLCHIIDLFNTFRSQRNIKILIIIIIVKYLVQTRPWLLSAIANSSTSSQTDVTVQGKVQFVSEVGTENINSIWRHYSTSV